MPRKFAVVAALLAAVVGASADDPKKPADAKKPEAPKAEAVKALNPDGAKAPSPAAAQAAPTVVAEKSRVSDAIGLNYGRVMRGYLGEEAIDAEAFFKGFKEGIAGKGELGREEIKTMTDKYHAGLLEERKTNFLPNNKKRPGVKVTASGLQYEVLSAGKGDKSPTKDQRVKVKYVGTLIDGTQFDAGETSFGVSEVIAGWTEALQMMKVGDKWRLAIPADLAYKDQQKGKFITPGSTLVFEVELLEIQ